MNQHKYKLVLILLALCFQCLVCAKQYKSNSLDIDRKKMLVDCQTKLQKLEWENSVWPKENTNLKPPYTEIYDEKAIERKVQRMLKKEAILLNRYNTKISHSTIQNELNRIAANTKNAESLKSVFQLLENNPNKISECIVIPYLLDRMIERKYYADPELHQQTENSSKDQLSQYLRGEDIDLSEVIVDIQEYSLKSIINDNVSQSYTQGLTKEQFDSLEKKYLLKKNTIQQRQYYFIHSEIQHKTSRSIKVKNLIWNKKPLSKWLDSIENYQTNKSVIKGINLPLIKFENNHFNQNSFLIEEDSWIVADIPSPRTKHTAIWTGTEMIIWGGGDGDSYTHNSHGVGLSTGSKYNPTTDSWQSMNLNHNIQPRNAHTAVWTGTEMIIWGGYNDSVLLNSGAKYNPLSDSWQEISLTNAPVPRERHTSVWTGSEMIVWGGINGRLFGGGVALSSGGKYNPSTDSWEEIQTPNVVEPRNNHTAVWTGNEMIIWGGFQYQGGGFYLNFNNGFKYSPDVDEWEQIIPNPDLLPRAYHTAIWTGNEMIIWGGQEFGPSHVVYNNGGKYNPETDSWETIMNSSLRTKHTAIWSGTHMIVWGGSNRYESSLLNDGEMYDPKTNIWNQMPNIDDLEPRINHSAIWTGSEMIIWGGHNDDESFIVEHYNDGGKFNPNLNTWSSTELKHSPIRRAGHTAIWTGNEMIVWAGSRGYDITIGDKYDPKFDRWEPVPHGDHTRAQTKAIWTGLEVIGFGGPLVQNGIITKGHVYNPLTDDFSEIFYDNPGETCKYFTLVWTGNEMIVYGFNDDDEANNFGTKYSPDSNTWEDINLTDSFPIARKDYSAVWTGLDMIIYGGRVHSGGQSLFSASLYNLESNEWRQANSNGAPRKSGHQAIWTGNEMLVLGGGSFHYQDDAKYNPTTDLWTIINKDNGPAYQDGGKSSIWTGTDILSWRGYENSFRYNLSEDMWYSISDLGAPTTRSSHSVIWAEDKMIIFGGSSGARLNSYGIYYPYGLSDIIFKNSFD